MLSRLQSALLPDAAARPNDVKPDDSINLAVVRIVVGVVLLLSAELHEAPHWAARLLDRAPNASPWVVAPVVSPALAWTVYALALAALFAGTLGFLTRWAWGVAAVSLFVVLGLPQQLGASTHYHHLWWLAVVMMVAPSGDALSLDAWMARRRGTTGPIRSPEQYRFMLRMTWLILGLVYLFPGLAKLFGGGLAWLSSESLQHHLWAKWAQDPSFSPLFRIDRVPWLLQVGGVAVILFELGFVFAVFSARWRYIALVCGVGFHAFTALFMNIQFSALWMCYAFFLPWDRWLAPDDATPRHQSSPRPSQAVQSKSQQLAAGTASKAVLATLLVGIVVTGFARQTDGWPFACYPTFHQPAPVAMPGLQVVAEDANGKRTALPVNWFGGRSDANRIWVWSWRLGQTPAGQEHQRFLTFALSESGTRWTSATLRKVTVSTHPDEAANVVHAGTVVASIKRR